MTSNYFVLILIFIYGILAFWQVNLASRSPQFAYTYAAATSNSDLSPR